jgi:hypothetical protein
VRGRHRAPGVVHLAVGLGELHRVHGAHAADRHHHVARQVSDQGGEVAAHLLGQPLARNHESVC